MGNSTQITTVPMVRIDRNIIHNIDSLFDAFGIGGVDMDDNLLRSIVYYLCLNYQQNLFAWSTFDPYSFAERMGYSKTFLRGRHPKPQFFDDFKAKARAQGKSEEEAEKELQNYIATGADTYETNLENALWSLWQKEIIFCYGAKYENITNKEEVRQHTITKMLIIRSLNITERRVGKTNQHQILYSVEMDERFVHSLTKYFIRANKDTLIALRKSKLDILYLKMLQYKEAAIYNQQPTVTIDKFELLCRWAGVASQKGNSEPVPNKTRKQQLIAALNTLKAKTDLDFEHNCTTVRRQKFPYTFVIQFNLNNEKYEARKAEDKEDLKLLFSEVLGRDLLNFWRCKPSNRNPLEFDLAVYNEWLFSGEDYSEKGKMYELALTKIYGQWKSTSGIKSYAAQAKYWLDGLREKRLAAEKARLLQ
jgi:hypothetical protein